VKRFGIDISSFQGSPVFGEVAKDVGFLIHRSWMGDIGEPDPTFTKSRVHTLRKHEIPFGVYCFARNAGGSGKVEARRFLNHAHEAGWGKKGDIIGWLDIENGEGGRPGVRFVREFAREYRRITGHRVGIYSGSFWRDVLHNPVVLTRSRFWLAAYTGSWKGWMPRAWKKPHIWQFTDSATVSGIEGGVDGDRFLRSEKAFEGMRLKHDLQLKGSK
jgi:GH25 family lysozyme M1 (1,4-beta-N-acetylmuramidase)